MPARRYGSALFAGLVLIFVGLIFLFENLHAPFSPMHLIARYWPLIFIFIGIKKLFDFFLWTDPSTPTNPTQGS
jgi:putative Mn2+ efflux pump MntP